MTGPKTSEEEPWRRLIGWREARADDHHLRLEADGPTRERIARTLGLEHLSRLVGELDLRRWLDGVEIDGRLEALAGRVCGVSLEDYDETVADGFVRRFVPPGSPAAPPAAPAGEVVIDLAEDDPPDEISGEAIDLGAMLVEQLALALDPFPRKPGAIFEAPPTEPIASPFAVLRRLKLDPHE